MLDSLSESDFRGCLHQYFHLSGGTGQTADLELVEVRSHAGASVSEGRSAFALLFRGPLDVPPQQWLYHLEHEALGPLDLFLVPVAADGQGVELEAVLN